MAARKRSGTRRKTTRARTRKSTTARKNPSLSLAKRRTSRRGSVVARSRRRGVSRRRSNPSSKDTVSLILGAGLAQLGAGVLSRFGIGGGPLIEIAKVVGMGFLLEKVGGRVLPFAFGRAQEGGLLAGGVLGFNAFLAGPIGSVLNSALPGGNGNGKGVNGIAVTPYPISPGMPPMLSPAQVANAAQRGVNGMATAPRMR